MTIRVAAVKIGVGVPQNDFAGIVQSTFRNAAILAVAGSLVTVVPARAGGLPGAISIDAPSGFEFDQAFAPGSAAAARAGILRIAGSAISIDLRSGTPWRSNLSDFDLDLTQGAVRSAWTTASDVLAADGRNVALTTIAAEPIASLRAATGADNVSAAAPAVFRLVGLGAGGTPAGDDFLVGFLAALWSSRRARDTKLVDRLAEIVAGLTARTNDVSRVYLEAAAVGEVSEPLAVLAATIAKGSHGMAVAEAARIAIAVGHTSGADGVTGLLAGAEAIAP